MVHGESGSLPPESVRKAQPVLVQNRPIKVTRMPVPVSPRSVASQLVTQMPRAPLPISPSSLRVVTTSAMAPVSRAATMVSSLQQAVEAKLAAQEREVLRPASQLVPTQPAGQQYDVPPAHLASTTQQGKDESSSGQRATPSQVQSSFITSTSATLPLCHLASAATSGSTKVDRILFCKSKIKS